MYPYVVLMRSFISEVYLIWFLIGTELDVYILTYILQCVVYAITLYSIY